MTNTPAHLFQKGADPRRGTKPKGTRNKVATAFFDDLHAIWSEQGEAVLRRAAFEKPMEFAAMVAKLMPAKLEISTPTHGLTDERFQELMDLAERQLALSASMTIEGQAVAVEEGGGDPQGVPASGGIIDLIPYSGSPAEPLLANQAPIFSAAPQATLSGEPASTPKLSATAAPSTYLDAEGDGTSEEDIDPASLF